MNRSSPRILFIATGVFLRGGVERYSRYFISSLREFAGPDQVRVFSLLGSAPGGFDSPFQVTYAGDGLGLANKSCFVLRCIAEALRWRPTVVICNHLSLAPIGLLARAAVRIPFIFMAHGLEIWSGLSWLDRLCIRRARYLWSGCEFTRQYLIRHFQVRPERMAVINDCVDMDRFHPMEVPPDLASRYKLPPLSGRKILMTVSRLDSGALHKGHERILRSLLLLPRREGFLYVVGGDGDQRARLERLAREWGLGDCVVFTGPVSESDLPAFYNLCDVFIMVSEFGKGKGEGLPLVLLEAAACGKPVIAGNADGSSEAVEDGVTGFAVPPHDLARIAERIGLLLRDDGLRRKMGLHAQERVVSRFSYPVFRREVKDFMMRSLA